jgi:hypothetical protein
MDAYRSILDEWGISESYFTSVVRDNPSLRGYALGYIAERKLRDLLSADSRVSGLRKDDDHDRAKKGDVTLAYRGFEFRVESKSLQTNSIRVLGSDGQWIKDVARLAELRSDSGHYIGSVQCDGSDQRDVLLPNGSRVKTTNLVVGEFDILAASLFTFRGRWDFSFCLNDDLPRTTSRKYREEDRPYLLKTLVPVSWPIAPPFVADPFVLLDRIIEVKQRTTP